MLLKVLFKLNILIWLFFVESPLVEELFDEEIVNEFICEGIEDKKLILFVLFVFSFLISEKEDIIPFFFWDSQSCISSSFWIIFKLLSFSLILVFSFNSKFILFNW